MIVSRVVKACFTFLVLVAVGSSAVVPSSVKAQDYPTMTLRVATINPYTLKQSEAIRAWADEIAKRTNGRINLEIYWSDSLVRAADMIDGLNAGLADIGMSPATYNPALHAHTLALEIPLAVDDYYCATDASLRVVHEVAALRDEYERAGVFPVTGYTSTNFQLITVDPLPHLADLAGRRLRTYGGAFAMLLEELGATPVFMSVADLYEALDRGVLDGADVTISHIHAWKYYEPAKHVLLSNTGQHVTAHFLISLELWRSFPPHVRALFEEMSSFYNEQLGRILIEMESQMIEELKAQGVQFRTPEPDEEALLREAAARAKERWLNELETRYRARGAREVAATFERLARSCEMDVKQRGYPWER